MEIDDLKLYSVIVGDGTGLLFQPMTREYTYILTAKHVFYDEIGEEGAKEKIPKPDGEAIKIVRLIKNANIWSSVPITFTIQKGVNYFPEINNDIDCALLKIDYIEGYDKIFIQDDDLISNEYQLCGFPLDKRNANAGNFPNQYTSHKISHKTNSLNYLTEVRLEQNKTQDNIIGMSGGGILKVFNTYITIIGIQSQMTKSISAQNEIDFVPIKFFNDLVNQNQGILAPLLPPYMSSFAFLKDEILKLEGCIDVNFIVAIRNALKQNVDKIQLNPFDIIHSPLKDQLLINNENKSSISSKTLWISWLEYLIVLQIVKKKVIDNHDLSVIFNEIRLIHSETDKDWMRIMPDIFGTDLYGLKEKGILIVSTRKKPCDNIIQGTEIINDIANATPVEKFKTDNAGIHPLSQFKFIHINVFEKECIVQNERELKNYVGINLFKLENKLKEIFDEIL